MSNIIAGRFQQQDQAQRAVEALVQAGFAATAISTFYVNPAGQHDAYPIGGDRNDSPGAKDTDAGLAAGVATGGAVGAAVGAAGAAIGAATAPVTGPLGAIAGGLVGAHIGALVGTLNKLEPDGHGENKNPVPVRSAGMLVAVQTNAHDAPHGDASGNLGMHDEERAIATLRAMGGTELERAQGVIVEGDWQDFDPVAAPDLLDGGQP
ncbi:MAG: hypothetical protein ACRYF5_07445 [Janthinobacterium lividum]